ncbi:MAG: S4 domain-containing protein [Gemmatimonadota bacterium]
MKARRAAGSGALAASQPAAGAPEPVRLDKWLWATRFFKTRALAAEAVAGGRVEVGGHRVKPGRDLKLGDVVRVRLGPYVHVVTVRSLAARRGPSAEAAKLFAEDPASRAERERLREQHRLAAHAFAHGEGKPTKKERRALDELRGR